MINQNPIITKIQNKLLEVSTLLEELSKDNPFPVPATIYRKWGLIDDSLVDHGNYDEASAMEEWSNTINKMAFLLYEIANPKANELLIDAIKKSDKSLEFHQKCIDIKDKDSDEYKRINTEKEQLDDACNKAFNRYETYMNGCLNEFVELFKQFWWDISTDGSLINKEVK